MTTRVSLFIVIAILLAGCGDVPPEPESSIQAAPVSVAVAMSTVEQWPSLYEATGTVRARSSTIVSSKWMGYVRDVRVQVGDRVTAGQLLASLDSRDLDAPLNRASAARAEIKSAIPEADGAVSAAKARLDLVESTFRRMRELYEKKSISDQEFDESTAKLKSAQADLTMARARRAQLDDKTAQAEQELRATQVARSYAEIQSPVAGMVTAKSVDPGNLAAPGAPLLTIEGGGYRLEASIEASKLSRIRMGQPVAVTFDGIDGSMNAAVSEIVPAVDASSRSYIVKINLASAAALRSGIFGRATFQLGSRPVLAIPVSAVIERGQLQSVFVTDGGAARTRLVTLGVRQKDHVEILSGLSSGEKVIVAAPQTLSDGTKVEVRP